MSTDTKVQQLEEILRRLLLSPELETYFNSSPVYPDGDGPDFSELKSTYQRLRALYPPLMDSLVLRRLPFQTANSLLGAAQGALNAYENFKGSTQDSVFRNFASQLDNLAHMTQNSAIQYLGSGGEALESARTSLANDQSALQEGLSRLEKNNTEVEGLKKQVQSLITPAVAGSLSKSFTERRDSLKGDRKLWLVISGVFALGAVLGLAYLGVGIAAALGTAKEGPTIWAVVAVRSLFLLPIFAMLGFAVSQYRKERNFEEEYAHKAAVAVSLPSYGELVPEGEVRNKIVSGAADAIFSSPIGRTTESESSATDVIKAAKEVIESAGNLMPWKK